MSFAISDLNPIIPRLLRNYPDSTIFGLGGHSVVLRMSSGIVAKVSLKPGDDRLQNEQKLFELLGQRQSNCPHLIQCYFRAVDVSFVQFFGSGTLHDRMQVKGSRPIQYWILQLSSAVACLEELGLAHGGINPLNILFDDADQVKLIDFDHSLTIGEPLDVGYEPYVRQYREFSGGDYGVAGPVSEQFALGSIFWYMTRGHELYSELQGPDRVHRLIDGILPDTDAQDPIDCIIRKCRTGYYPKMANLVEDIKDTLGGRLQPQETISLAKKEEMSGVGKEYCT